MDLGLRDRTYIVTGSSRGLGFDVARHFALEGARVVLNGRDGKALVEAVARIRSEVGDAAVAAVPGEMQSPEVVAQLLAAATVLGNFAGLVLTTPGTRHGSWETAAEADWMAAFEGVIMGAIRMLKPAIPLLVAQGGGSVLFVASSSVLQPEHHLVVGNSVRPGVLGLSKTLAARYGRQGVRFNVICPGPFRTDRYTEKVSRMAREQGVPAQEIEQRLGNDTLLGRVGNLDEFGPAAVFLSSPCSSFITGSVLAVDGGKHASLI